MAGRFKRFHWVLKALPAVVLYSGILLGAPAKWPAYWFFLAALTLPVYALYAVAKKRDFHASLFLLCLGLLVAGFIEHSGMRWLHMAYMPYVLAAGVFFSPRVLAASFVSVPLFEARHIGLAGTPELTEELSLLALVMLTAATGAIARARKIQPPGPTSVQDVSPGGLNREKDDEVRDALTTALYTVRPDTLSLFLLEDGELALRCSTDMEISLLKEGLVHEAVLLRQPIVTGRLRKERMGPGYDRIGRISSLVAAPVMDGSFVLGVLAADSNVEGAFGEDKVKAITLFAGQIAKILLRRRIYDETEKSNLGMAVLHEESSRMISSLELEDLAETTIEGMQRIAPLDAAFLLKQNGTYRFVTGRGIKPPKDFHLSMKDTLADMAATGKHPLYLSNLKGHTRPVLPFDGGRAASTLIIPLIFKDEVMGLIVFISPGLDPLNPWQIKQIEVLGNQSAMSLKNAMFHADIKRMAVTDGLTGLYNHKHFHERLDEELSRFRRTKRPLCMLLIDIDFFKKINDTYGHQAGDEVLRGVSGIIRDTLRETDVAGRYGGEEFAALLIDTDMRGAARMAERLRRNILRTEIRFEGRDIKVTASVGIAACEGSEEAEELVAKADRALYRAKETGRNRVVSYSEIDQATV